VAIRAVPVTAAAFDYFNVSSNGTTAVLIGTDHRRLRVLSGFPNVPAPVLEFSETTLPQGTLRRAAVNDDATAVLVAMSFGDTETIYRWNRNSGFVVLAPSYGVDGMAFINNTEAVYTDKVRNEVHLVHDVLGQPWIQLVAGAEDGILSPIATATGGGEFHVANAASGTIISFDASGHLLRSQVCGCKISRLSPISRQTFLLTDRPNETMFVMSGTGTQGRIAFIPPAK
jgi:hypothetical protein